MMYKSTRLSLLTALFMISLSGIADATSTSPQSAPAPVLAPAVKTMPQGTPLDNAAANKIYAECIDDPFKFNRINPISRDLLCSCLSAGYQAEMTVEDMDQLKKVTTPAGRAVYARMLEKVYFPCATPAIEESLKAECAKRAAAGDMGLNTKSSCRCVFNRMTGYVSKIGIPQLLYSAQSSGQIGEPFDVLTNSGEYSRTLIESYYTCFNGRVP
jgi:hypothetical protein